MTDVGDRGRVDTEMNQCFEIPKGLPESVARAIFDAVEERGGHFQIACERRWLRVDAAAPRRRSSQNAALSEQFATGAKAERVRS